MVLFKQKQLRTAHLTAGFPNELCQNQKNPCKNVRSIASIPDPKLKATLQMGDKFRAIV